MKKRMKLTVVFLVGLILGATLTVTATLVTSANNITFSSDKTDKTNVKEALDELYLLDNGSSLPPSSYYGVKRSITTSSSAWERIGASIGKEANAQIGTTEVKNDFDNIYPWSDIKSYNYDTGTKSITAWYGEENFTFTPSGNIEVLTYIPEFYYRRTQIDGTEYILISKDPLDKFTKSEAFSIGRYTISYSSASWHSRSGIKPNVNNVIGTYRSVSKALGEGFQQLDYHYFIIQLLYLVEYADYNAQVKLGLGNTANSTIVSSGGCDELGMKSGTMINDGKHSVIYRGMEDLYGNIWQWIDGINIQNHQAYINYNPSTYQVDKYDGDYKKIGYLNEEHDANISKLGYDIDNPLVAFPTEGLGSPTTYITDVYRHYSYGAAVVRVGGSFSDSSYSGLWRWGMDYTSSTENTDTGGRFLKTS